MASDFVQRGRLLLEQGQFQEAVKVCRLGLLASPTALEGRLVLGSALTALRRFDEVLAEMRVALELDAGSAWALALKGEALLRKGDAAQACDVLTRAMTAAPADPRIRELYGEARRMREQGIVVPRPTADGLSTRHYPFGGARPGNDTTGAGTTGRLGRPAGGHGLSPSFDGITSSTGGGSVSGTIELEPSTVVADYADLHPRTVAPVGEASGIELHTGDLIPADLDGEAGRQASAARPPGPTAADDRDGMTTHARPRPAASADDRDGVTTHARARPAASVGAARGAPGPELDALFPDEDSGERAALELDPATRRDPAPPRQEPERGPAVDPMLERPMDREAMRLLRRLPASFGGEPDDGPVRSQTDDMRTIRSGLGLPAEGTSPGRKVAPEVLERERAEARRVAEELASLRSESPAPIDVVPPPSPRAAAARPAAEARRWPLLWLRLRAGQAPLALYLGLALVVVAGAVFAGFAVRDLRLERQIRRARATALELAATDTYTNGLRARESFERIVRVRADDRTRAAHARMAARLFAEFGDGELDAATAAERLGDASSADATAARAFLALGRGDLAGASAEATALAKRAPGDRDADYLVGRTALSTARPRDAAEALRRALVVAPHPLVEVHLARAEAAQGRTAEALATLERALKSAPRHPAATIWSALLRARANQAPPSAGEPEGALGEVIADGSKPLSEQRIGVAPSEVAWAELALAEVALSRGDTVRARAALDRAAAVRTTGADFSAALAETRLRAGDVKGARAEAARLVEAAAGGAEARVLAARIALGAGAAAEALAALDHAGDLAARPDVLALRGRAELLVGAVDKAAADLDAALAVRPDHLEAVIGRAEVDLARGEPEVALKRLQPLYQDGAGGGLLLTLAYAEATRATGDLARARAILDRLAGAAPSYELSVARGRMARAEGAYEDARRAFTRASEQNPAGLAARRELASLSLDLGDVATSRALLDALLLEAPELGDLLLEDARVHTLTGDHAGARALLEKAAARVPPPPGLDRERGRLRLRELDGAAAVTALEAARAADPDDLETELLLLEAAVVARQRGLAGRIAQAIAKRIGDAPSAGLARGMAAVLAERYGEAIEELLRAHAALAAAKAPPREIARAVYWLGRAFYLEGNSGKATEWLTRATEIDASQADAYFFLGQVAFEGGALGRMTAAYQRSVAIDPAGNPSAWFFLAEYHARTGASKEARAAAEEYLRRWPDGDFAEPLRALRARLR